MFELLKHGKANKVIARDLSMSESMVKVHVRSIMRKMKVSNRTDGGPPRLRHKTAATGRRRCCWAIGVAQGGRLARSQAMSRSRPAQVLGLS